MCVQRDELFVRGVVFPPLGVPGGEFPLVRVIGVFEEGCVDVQAARLEGLDEHGAVSAVQKRDGGTEEVRVSADN